MTALSMWEVAARVFDPQPRTYPRPGDLARDLDPSTRTSPCLDLLDDALVALMDDPTQPDRLAFYMPPQEGKSERVSRRFPLWALVHDPTLRIAVVSYDGEASWRWGRAIKRDMEQAPHLGVQLREDVKSAGRWETRQGGGLYCTGIRGALTGRPVDLLIIDDPVKDRANAESRTFREGAWDFWENVAVPRLSSRGRVVLVMTRWHHDDLGGRLHESEPAEWRTIAVPAISTGQGDPLSRPEGAELPSVQGRKPGYFHALSRKLSPYVWGSLYQQRPTAAEGHLFKRGDYRYWTGVGSRLALDGREWDLADCTRFITIDLATSIRTSSDYTVAAAWAITPNGDLVLLDRARDRVDQAAHFDLVTPLRTRWLTAYDVTYVESAMFGTTFVYQAGRQGLFIQELHADADKLTRALPASGLVTQHRVWWPANAPWLDEWTDELADFPVGTHDDQVDVFAYAARVAITHWTPTTSTGLPSGPRYQEPVVDFMRADF